MAMFNDPNAVRRKPPLGPNIVSVSAPTAPEIPGGGMTLDALMARQKAVAGQRIPMGEMRSPMQGAAYALERGLQGFQEGMLQRHEGEARDALAKAMTQVDPVTGEYRPEAMATIGALMPEQAFEISRDTVKSRRDIARQEDEQAAARDLAKQQQDFTGGQNELNRAADAARVRMQEAAADGRQDDAQAAAQDLAKINAELDIAKDQLASERKVTDVGAINAAREAEADRLKLEGPERDKYITTGTMDKPGESFGDVVTGEAAAAQGLDPGKQWQQNKTTGEWKIAGGAGISLNLPPAEIAARIALGDEFQKGVPQLLADIKEGQATGLFDQAAGWMGQGRSGQIRRQIGSGVDALVRHLTGAGKSQQEAEDYAFRYMPTATDNADILTDKITRLSEELDAIKSGVMKGRAGEEKGAAAAPAAGGGGKPADIPQAEWDVMTPEEKKAFQ